MYLSRDLSSGPPVLGADIFYFFNNWFIAAHCIAESLRYMTEQFQILLSFDIPSKTSERVNIVTTFTQINLHKRGDFLGGYLYQILI